MIMSKKVKILTREQLEDIIAESVITVMNEIDAKTYSRVHKASVRARKENQKGNFTHKMNDRKVETNDEIIAHGINLEPMAADSMISSYKGKYMFYCKNLRQNVGITLFTLKELFELTSTKAILKGDVVFNNMEMRGSIIVNINNGDTFYYHTASRKKYPLEIDNRFKSRWDKLVSTLQEAANIISNL